MSETATNALLPGELRAWRADGDVRRVHGLDVFFRVDGPPSAEPLLVLHGFPSSSFDFHLALPHLAGRTRVVVHDHPGFGLSAKPREYSYSLLEQAEVALGLWRDLGIERGHLLAHDYGTSVATEILARRERAGLPLELTGVTLTNGSVHIELAELTLSQRLMRGPLGPLFVRLSSRRYFRSRLRAILGRPDALPDRELDLMWAGIEHAGGRRRLPAISSYLDERTRFWHRWIGALRRLDLPTHVLWGRRDPIAVPAIAEQLAAEIPDARLTWLETLGHYPMLEDAAQWSAAVTRGVRGLERS